MHNDELTTLLLEERPRPRETFAAELDDRVAARFAGPPRGGSAPSRARAWSWPALLHRPFLPAAATALAVGLVALVVALSANDGPRIDGGAGSSPGAPALVDPSTSADGGGAGTAAPELADPDRRAAADQAAPATGGLSNQAPRKVERTASVELGTDPDRVDDVAQDVLGVVARFDAIVDSSSVRSSTGGGEAHFELRIPAERLQPALAALSRLPDAQVLSRTDDTRDVNQAYVSVRRQLANARAERTGVVRALANADSEDETLRLRARLDALERTIAGAERTQRALDRRVDWSRVTVGIYGGAGGGAVPTDDGTFGIGDAARDALRVLEVAAGVIVIAAAALLPVALLAVLVWPLARGARRRRREQALDAA